MNEIIHEIVLKAETLHERIVHKTALSKQDFSEIDEARLQEWKAVCSLNDEVIFNRRLINDDLSESEVFSIVCETNFAPLVPLPEWALKFDKIRENLLMITGGLGWLNLGIVKVKSRSGIITGGLEC